MEYLRHLGHLRAHRIQGVHTVGIVVVVDQYRGEDVPKSSLRLLVTIFGRDPIGARWVTVSLDTDIIG